MANINSGVGYQNLPLQSINGSTETALVVPAQGLYGGSLPSPALQAGGGLSIGIPSDIVGSVYDGHPFLVSIVGKVLTAGSYTFKLNLYQVPGTIVAAGTQGTLSNDHAVTVGPATSSGAAGTQNFIFQAQFLWDSTSKLLGGFVTSFQLNGVNLAVGTPSGTAGQMQVVTTNASVGIADLNFIPSFTFGTAGVNGVTLTEFVIDRV